MTDTKTTGLGALAANPADTDKFMVVDVSDTTMAASGTNKYLDASYVVFATKAQTLTNKTLTAPVIATISNSGTLTLPTSTDTLVGRDTTDTLTNKTLSTPTIASFANAGHDHQDAAGGGQLDHGAALTGLGDDDHTQYLLATGARTGASSSAQTFTNGILVGDGSVSAPIVTFSGDANSGIYRIASDTLGFAVGGTRAGSFGLSGSNRECRVGDGSNIVKMYVDGGSSNVRDLVFMSGGSSRWLYRVDDTPESGANAGSNFVIIGRADDGSSLGNYFFINRATGNVAVGNNTNPTAVFDIVSSTTIRASLRLRAGVAPTTPNAGDIWYLTGGRLQVHRAATETIASGVTGSAFTQTYSTADRTIGAYTADSESSAYTGIDNAQAGTVYAQLTDLNALRTAYENLRAFTEDAVQALNALIDDAQAFGISG